MRNSIQHDTNIKCCSVLTEMKVIDYLSVVEHSYKNKGGLKQQRPPLKTASARDIRNRMVADITKGAVLPPVVLGIVDKENSYVDYINEREGLVKFLLENQAPDNVTIIDGMQRTTAIMEAVEKDNEVLNMSIRVEIWFASSVSPLIYRMLILNTGQIPWDITRQLDTIYSPLINEIKSKLPEIDIYTKDDSARRSGAAQYQSSHIIELYMIFSSREVNIEVKETMKNDFARLNIIESAERYEFLEYFIESLSYIAKFDRIFSRATTPLIEAYLEKINLSNSSWKIKNGQDIFKSAPARAGFISSIASFIFDDAGFDIEWSSVPEKISQMKNDLNHIIDKLETMPDESVVEFISLETLNEKLGVKVGKVGEYERELYNKSFSSMRSNANRLMSMKPCWIRG